MGDKPARKIAARALRHKETPGVRGVFNIKTPPD